MLSSLNWKLDLEWSVESDRGLKAAINGWSLSQAILGRDKAVVLTMSMLLDSGRRLGASDDRDKVFGFLGLADWFALNREGAGFPDWFSFDYSKPAADVFRDATRLAILETGELHVLEAGDEESFEERELGKNGFPSWVPRYDRLDRGPHAMGVTNFQPCGDRPMDKALAGDRSDPNVLMLKGYIVAQVSTILPALASESDDPDVRRTEMEAFFADCVRFLVDNKCEEKIQRLLETMTFNEPYKTRKDDGPANFKIDMSEGSVALKVDEEHAYCLDEFYEIARKSSLNRRLFLIDKKMLGAGPASIEVGDQVVLLFGARTYFIVRPDSSGADSDRRARNRCRLVGQCYMAQLMGNELVTKLDKAGVAPVTIELC